MAFQLLKATALALLQAVAVHCSDGATTIPDNADNDVVVSDASQVVAPTSFVNQSLINQCQANCDRDESHACRLDCERKYIQRHPDGRTRQKKKNRVVESRDSLKGKNIHLIKGDEQLGKGSESKSNEEKKDDKKEHKYKEKGAKSDKKKTSTDRRPTSECQELGESAAEFLVFYNVCIPTKSQGYGHDSPEYSKSCREVAYGVCQSKVSPKADKYCPNEHLGQQELHDLKEQCYDEVNDLTGGGMVVAGKIS